MHLKILLLCMILIAAACSDDSAPALVATDILITKPVPGTKMSAAYFTLVNNTDRTVTISDVRSGEFAAVEIHETILDNGVAKMRRLDDVRVPANSTMTFQRGSKHLMLMRPVNSPSAVTLSFYSGETLILDVNVAVDTGSH